MNHSAAQLQARRRGFTLMEVLVTMVLMGIVLPIALRAVSVARSAATTARRTSEAATLAQAKLSEIVASGDVAMFGLSGDFGQEWSAYQWACQTLTDAQGFTQVTLTVTWREQGRQRSFNLSTLMSDPAYSTTEVP
jgi:prepilin-type N-terminal cleavage/methylation domain-containing protein